MLKINFELIRRAFFYDFDYEYFYWVVGNVNRAAVKEVGSNKKIPKGEIYFSSGQVGVFVIQLIKI